MQPSPFASRGSFKRNRTLQMNAGIVSIVAHSVESALRAGRIAEVEQLLATIRLRLSPVSADAANIDASAKATLLLCGAACAHLLGVLDEADRYLCRLDDLTLSTHLSANQLSASQRLHVRVHLDLGNDHLARQVLQELDRDVLHLGAEQVLTERGGRTVLRRVDSTPRIFGDKERLTPATHLLAAEFFLAIGQVDRAGEEVASASNKIGLGTAEDALALPLLEGLLSAIKGDQHAYSRLAALHIKWRTEESGPDERPNIPAELRGRLSAIIDWDPQAEPPNGINIFESRRWKSFADLVPEPTQSDPSPHGTTQGTLIVFPQSSDRFNVPKRVSAAEGPPEIVVEHVDDVNPFADLLADFESLQDPDQLSSAFTNIPQEADGVPLGLPVDRLAGQPFNVGLAEQNVLSVPDLAAFPFDSILTTLEQTHISGELDLFWSPAIIESAVSDSVLEERIECNSGTIFFRDGRIIDAVLSGATFAETTPYESLSIMVRLALSIGQGISAFLRRSDLEQHAATLNAVNNSGILLQILGTLDEDVAGADHNDEPEIARLLDVPATSPGSDDALRISEVTTLLDARTPKALVRVLREVVVADRSELVYGSS
ncbi:MAG: DUF4388 domain-containing protein, partial [Blastocatellia bacterium]